MKEKAMIYALRTFMNKAKTEQYWVAECLLTTNQTTKNFVGYNQVTVFLTQEQYNTLLNGFAPSEAVELNVSLMGNRVSYSLAS